MKHQMTGLLVGGLLLALAPAAPAATVTVRAEGGAGPLLAATPVATPAGSVAKDGNAAHACAANSVVGALEAATAGDWAAGPWSDSYSDTTVERIKGESYPFSQDQYYWEFVRNDETTSTGVCQTKLADGDEVLFIKRCYMATSGCWTGKVLATKAPATARPGEAFPVSVQEVGTSYGPAPDYAPTTTRTASGGAAISGGGASATTGADGGATVTLADRGPQTLRVTKGDNVPDEVVVCVTDGADGF
ncbi:MAG: hypothetical protein HZB46_02695 [Solirubrobacterales bacterium]|nr:hypothetical protein [Solirubrobacterales bacterium]